MTDSSKKVWAIIQKFVPVLFATIALGFLFAPFINLEFKNKTVDPAEVWNETYNIITFLKNWKPFHFTFIIFLVLMLIGIVFAIIYDKHQSFGFISVMSFVLSYCLFVMQSGFYV